jgi:hypothetical protein
MKSYYSKEIGSRIHDLSGAPQMGNVRFFPGPGGGAMGNVQFFPGQHKADGLGNFGNFGFDAGGALSDALKNVLPGVGQNVINNFLASPDGQQLATQVQNTAYQVGEQAAASQAAQVIAQNEAKYKAQIQSLMSQTSQFLANNWKTMMLVAGLAVGGIVLYTMMGKPSRAPAAANPRKRRKHRRNCY